MGASEDHVPIMRDWAPLSTDFSSMRNNDIASRSVAGFDRANLSGIQSSLGGNNEASNSNALSGPRSSLSGGRLVERMAARAGFNAPRLNMESIRPPELYTNPDVRSPYLTIPPGLSPTTLLESPVFLSNSMAFPSPTTGKFPFFPSGNSLDSSTMTDNRDKEGKTNTFEDTNASSYASFRGVSESPITHSDAANGSSFHNGEVYFRSEQQNTCPPKVNSENNVLFYQTNFSKSNAEDNGGGNLLMDDQTYYSVGVVENSPPFEDNSPTFEEHQQNDDVNQRLGDQDPNNGGGSGEDGYNWRKYGQKHVKGSEYPRSYYKCTQLNCPVKKKVERSHEGHITEIIYKGAHNHPKPSPNRRSVIGSANALSDVQLDSEQLGLGAASDLFWPVMPKGNTPENTNGGVTNMLVAQSGTPNEVGDGVEFTNVSNNDDDDRVTHGSVSLGQDGEGDESESKRRRTETSAAEVIGATRAIREPRVVVQTKSEIDILDDGYRWRKYGQKVVKGNPNPRSYYKCTSPGCNVRKHVERASHDLKSVITTYEGKHNHDVPAARNSNSGGPNNQQASISMNQVHRPKPCPVRGRSAWLERSQPSSYGLQGQQQVGSGFGYGMNGLMTSLGTNQGNLSTFPVHAYAGNQVRPMNELTYMLSKEELESERMMDSGLSSVVGSSIYYQQLMSQLPLGPQM